MSVKGTLLSVEQRRLRVLLVLVGARERVSAHPDGVGQRSGLAAGRSEKCYKSGL